MRATGGATTAAVSPAVRLGSVGVPTQEARVDRNPPAGEALVDLILAGEVRVDSILAGEGSSAVRAASVEEGPPRAASGGAWPASLRHGWAGKEGGLGH